MATASKALIDDLDYVLAGKPIGDRATMLRRITDLFVVSSTKLTDEQLELFDDVMGRLLEEIEVSTRAAFGHVLAITPNAPPRVIQRLASDDLIGVAGPVLMNSDRVNDRTLVQAAETKGQEHLLAISRRKTLSETVTDVLVSRGNEQVICNTASNSGAAFSKSGYSTLVQKSFKNYDLAACVWSRPEIPRQHLLKLFSDASESVRSKLISRDPSKANIILEIVAQASQVIHKTAREKSSAYIAADAYVRGLHEAGALSEENLNEFARVGKFDETAIGFSLLCDLPIAVIDRAFGEERWEQIIVMAKAAGISWGTVKNMLLLQGGTDHLSRHKTDELFEVFERLRVDTARKAILFYRLREQAANKCEPKAAIEAIARR